MTLSVFIASYSLVDARGVRASHDAFGYAAALTLIFLAIVLILSIWQTVHMDRNGGTSPGGYGPTNPQSFRRRSLRPPPDSLRDPGQAGAPRDDRADDPCDPRGMRELVVLGTASQVPTRERNQNG